MAKFVEANAPVPVQELQASAKSMQRRNNPKRPAPRALRNRTPYEVLPEAITALDG